MSTVYLLGLAVNEVLSAAKQEFYDLSSYPNPTEFVLQPHHNGCGPTKMEAQQCLQILRAQLPAILGWKIPPVIELREVANRYLSECDLPGTAFQIVITDPNQLR